MCVLGWVMVVEIYVQRSCQYPNISSLGMGGGEGGPRIPHFLRFFSFPFFWCLTMNYLRFWWGLCGGLIMGLKWMFSHANWPNNGGGRGLIVKFKRGRTANPKRLKVRRFSTGRFQISKLFCLVGMRVGEEKQVQYKNFLGNCNTTLVSTKTSSKSDMSGTGLK